MSISRSYLELLRDLFTEAFQVECPVFEFRKQRWLPAWINGIEQGSEDAELADACLAVSERLEEPVVVAAGDGQRLLYVPVELPDGQRCLVVVAVNGGAERLLIQLGRTTRQLFRLQVQNEEHEQHAQAFSRQICDDWEELASMKQLADQFDSCDIRNDVHFVLETLLPAIAQVTRAEALCFLKAPGPGLNGHGFRDLFHLSDACLLSRQQILDFFSRIQPEISSQPYINNAAASLGSPQSVNNCVALQIRNDFGLVGYLLALNKIVGTAGQRYDDGSCFAPLHDDPDFGSPEVSVLYQVASIIRRHSANIQLYEEKKHLVSGIVRTLVCTIESRDSYTFGHSDRVASMARELARLLGYSSVRREEIYMTGLLHDIGKIGVPDGVLLKPGKLTEEEFELIRRHVTIGHDLLLPIEQLHFALPGVLHHHEAWNGSGYPHGLKGDQIPHEARILAVVDTFDAMTSRRPYRDPMPMTRACSILAEGAGQQWDPEMIEVFLQHRSEVTYVAAQALLPEFQMLANQRNIELGTAINQAVDSLY